MKMIHLLWIFFVCSNRLDDWLKLFPHAVQWYGFSPVWILWCSFSSTAVRKVFSHSKHIWSLTPVCIFWCSFKFCSSEKLFPPKEHECGFTFEWTFRWFFRLKANWLTGAQVRKQTDWLNRPSASRLTSQKSVNSQRIETLSSRYHTIETVSVLRTRKYKKHPNQFMSNNLIDVQQVRDNQRLATWRQRTAKEAVRPHLFEWIIACISI